MGVFVAGGRYPNLTTASARAQCLRLSESFFHVCVCVCVCVCAFVGLLP